MTGTGTTEVSRGEGANAGWRGLYRVSGVAALIAALVFRRWLAAEIGLLRDLGVIQFEPAPTSTAVLDWFTLLQEHRLLGLALLDFFDLVNYALVGLILLGLCVALREAKGWMAIVAALGLTGVACYFASNQAFALLALSDEYAAATSEAQRGLLLAAGQGMLTAGRFTGGSGIWLGFSLVTLAGLISSVVMVRNQVFGRAAAYVGIVANGLGLGALITLAVAPAMIFIPLSASAPFLLVWYVLLGIRFLRLGGDRSR